MKTTFCLLTRPNFHIVPMIIEDENIPEYERARLKRIQENQKKLLSLVGPDPICNSHKRIFFFVALHPLIDHRA